MAERKIGKETYRCHAMPAGAALELLGDITRLASQGAGRLPAVLLGLEEHAAGVEGGEQMADVAVFAAIGDILQRNSSSDLRALVERVVTAAEVQRPAGYAKIDLDEEFTGNLGAILPVARFVLEVNFRDFLDGSAGPGPLSRFRAAFQSGK